MSETSEETSLLERLLSPEWTPVSDTDRKLAATRITQAQAIELITDEEAQQRHAALRTARTRADLRVALDGLPGGTPAGFRAALRIITAIWLGVCVIQFTIWLLICIINLQLISPFWIWTVGGGGIILGGLWWLTGQGYRRRDPAEREGPSAS